MRTPTVSVIIPNYNHARFLHQRIESVLRQTYEDFEMILLDDCSTDESRSILSQYASDPRVRIEFNEANSGSTFKQWNKGVRMAAGEYVWLAESDDYADNHFLQRLVTVLDSDESISFVYCRSWTVSESGQLLDLTRPELPHSDQRRWMSDFSADGAEECKRYFVRTNVVPNASAVVFRKTAYEGVGGADEDLRLCGDWKLWAAMALGGKVNYISDPLNFFRCHDSSVRAKSDRAAINFSESFHVMRWVLERVPSARTTLRPLLPILAAAWVPVVLSRRVPADVKRTVLREMRAIDPYVPLRVLKPLLTAVRLKIRKHWRELTSHAIADRQVEGIGK